MLLISEDTEKDEIYVSAYCLTHREEKYVPKKLDKTWNLEKIFKTILQLYRC